MSNTQAPATSATAPGPSPGNAQWIGTRQEQQDAFGFAGFDEHGQASGEAVLAVVADGMGGLSEGRAASQGAVSAFLAAWYARPAQQPVPETLLDAIEKANRAVQQLACATAGEGEVGTTLIAVVIEGNQLYWIAAGDSRIYWYRAADGSLTPCNEEHNLALQLWREAPATGLSPDEIQHHPEREHLISFLGLAAIPEIDRNVRPLNLQAGDRLLLCSDGVDGTLTLDDLKLSLAGDPQSAAEGIIALVQAQNRPHQGNATVAILALVDPIPAPVVTPVSDPPTRRSSAKSPRPPLSNQAQKTIFVIGGLILTSLLGIAGWYYLQGIVLQGPSKLPVSPVAKTISQPLELPKHAESEPRLTQQNDEAQQPADQQPPESSPVQVLVADENVESADDRNEPLAGEKPASMPVKPTQRPPGLEQGPGRNPRYQPYPMPPRVP